VIPMMLVLGAALAATPGPQRVEVLCLTFGSEEIGPIALTDGPQIRDGRVRWSRWDAERIRTELHLRGVDRERALAAMDFRLADEHAATQQCGTCYLGIYYPAKQSCGRYYGQTVCIQCTACPPDPQRISCAAPAPVTGVHVVPAGTGR